MTGERGTPNSGRHDAAADTHARPQPGTSTPQDRKNHYFIPATDKTVVPSGMWLELQVA